jgi:RNA polymerase-binding transcription factor DksA
MTAPTPATTSSTVPATSQATTAPDLTDLRAALEAEFARHGEILADLSSRAAPNVDPVAYMTTAEARRVMARIEAALERIGEGSYGRCIRCGGAIVPERLEILPYAETCIECQSALERP